MPSLQEIIATKVKEKMKGGLTTVYRAEAPMLPRFESGIHQGVETAFGAMDPKKLGAPSDVPFSQLKMQEPHFLNPTKDGLFVDPDQSGYILFACPDIATMKEYLGEFRIPFIENGAQIKAYQVTDMLPGNSGKQCNFLPEDVVLVDDVTFDFI